MELVLSLPRDVRFAETAGAVAVHAAKLVGHAAGEAEAFGRRVEARVRESLAANGSSSDPLPVIVRQAGGPVEVLVNGHVLRLQG